MYYVYILENADRGWYIGFTGNLRRRFAEHNSRKGGRTTSLKSDWYLIYYEAYREKGDALGRERFLKSGAGRRYIKKQLTHYLCKALAREV